MQGERKTCEEECFTSFESLLEEVTLIFSGLSPLECVEDDSGWAV